MTGWVDLICDFYCMFPVSGLPNVCLLLLAAIFVDLVTL